MALEDANYIPELDETNPQGNDPANTLDDHDRLTKRAVKNSFSGFVGTTATPKSVTLTEDQINDAALQSAVNTFSTTTNFDGNIYMANNLAYYWRKTDDTLIPVLLVDSSDEFRCGRPEINTKVNGLEVEILHDNAPVAKTVPLANGSILVNDMLSTPRKVGYRNPFRLSQGDGNFTAEQSWEGTVAEFAPTQTRTITFPPLEAYTTLRIENSGTDENLILAEGSGLTILWYDGSGSRKFGNRTLAGGSIVEIYYAAANVIHCFGNGLS